MNTMTFTNAQLSSVDGARITTEVTIAIAKADELAEASGSNMTVVRTKSYGLCVWPDFKVMVRKDEITETVYSSDDGFFFSSVA